MNKILNLEHYLLEEIDMLQRIRCYRYVSLLIPWEFNIMIYTETIKFFDEYYDT